VGIPDPGSGWADSRHCGFRIPLWGGVLITIVDTFFFLFLDNYGEESPTSQGMGGGPHELSLWMAACLTGRRLDSFTVAMWIEQILGCFFICKEGRRDKDSRDVKGL
jgi:hypothetical protein